MSPAELRRLNIERFSAILVQTTDAQERARIERLIAEERAKPDSAYPAGEPDAPSSPADR